MKKTKLGKELLAGMSEIIADQKGKLTLRSSELDEDMDGSWKVAKFSLKAKKSKRSTKKTTQKKRKR